MKTPGEFNAQREHCSVFMAHGMAHWLLPVQIAAFGDILRSAGAVCTVRESRGDDGMAACGQLGNVEAASGVAPVLKPPLQFAEALATAPSR